IPGLIDSHVHVLRAGLTWNDIVRWDDITSLAAGLERIREAAESRPGSTWIRVLGGWHPGRFAEGRGPTRGELDSVGGEHPVYVQPLYGVGVLNSTGLELVRADGEVPGVERDDEGRPTGKITGQPAFGRVLSLFERPSFSEQKASTQALVADFLSRGVTGAIEIGRASWRDSVADTEGA